MAGLYIHIPFCRRKCKYCDFVSFPEYKNEDLYFVALISEMRRYAELMRGRTFDTVFIGGGTPTTLKPGRIAALLDEARRCFDIAQNAEITCEANPESASENKLYELYNAGVYRLSLGLQSACDSELAAIGRLHNVTDFITAVKAAKSVGFSNINADVMHGLPLQTRESYIDTLRLLCELELTHISSYSLILEEGTPLYCEVADGSVLLPDDDAVADMEDAGFDFLKNNGYIRYEVSNFAKAGFECAHNLNYWNNGEYLGVGLNSHSALRINGDWTRFNNTSVMSEYINELGDGKLPVRNTTKIAKNEEMFESVMLGLRKCNGILRKEFEQRFGVDPVVNYAAAVSALELDNMIEVSDEYLRLNKRGMDFQNEALLKFMEQ